MRWDRRWDARWIWIEDSARAHADTFQVDVVDRRPDTVVLFRRTFEIDDVPSVCPARITADGRYRLFVNGALLGMGPVRGEPAHLRWDEYDLAPFLRTGVNVVAVLVRHYGVAMPYWKPARPMGALGCGSFLFEARVGGGVVASDASWRARRAPYERAPEMRWTGTAPAEIVDGRAYPWGWTEPEFDDTDWRRAVEVVPSGLGIHQSEPPTDPFGPAGPSEIAALAERIVRPRGVVDRGSDGDRWTLDLGEIVNAHPILTVDAEPGTVFDLTCGEDLDEGGNPVAAPRNWTLRYTAAGRRGETVEALDPVGLRYVQVAVSEGRAQAVEVAARYRHYPRPAGATFSCDDSALDAIWRAGAATLDACSTDAFIDCPGREQRAWLGDAYVETLISLACNPDTSLARWNARLHAQGARADGLRPMVAGGDFTDIITIPDYSLHWVRTIARLYEHLGDVELVRDVFPRALDALAWFEHHRGPDGLLADMTGWIFIDWAQTERGRNIAAVDALYALALDDAACLAEALGDEGTARRLRARADRSREAFERYWDEDRGVYVDAADPGGSPGRRVSQHTNALAILCDAVPPDRWERIMRYIDDPERLVMTRHPGDGGPASERLWYHWRPAQEFGTGRPFDDENGVVMAQPFFCHFLHQAFARAGRRDLLLRSIRRWAPLVARGNGVLEEYWTHVPGHGSRCHAWSATPTFDLPAHVLGVRRGSIGWDTVRIEPWFGPLSRIEGSVPTPRGFVRASLARDGTGLVELPEGMTGVLRAEEFGSRLALESGRNPVSFG